MRFGIVVFPGSNCEQDTLYALRDEMGQQADYVWHTQKDLSGFDCIILPGGFSYGDYLRAGAIARFSPVMDGVVRFAKSGGLVLGICNGFQILLEAGLLPGAMLKNASLRFSCRHVYLRAERDDTPFTRCMEVGQVLRIPIAHYEGNYYASAEAIEAMEKNGQIVFRYCDAHGNVSSSSNPNGSVGNIAGITNAEGNVLGMMPHPERACSRLLGGEDGKKVFESIITHLSKVA